MGPAVHCGTLSATAKRGVHDCDNPIPKNPLLLIPITMKEHANAAQLVVLDASEIEGRREVR